jgi:hypothetical protein
MKSNAQLRHESQDEAPPILFELPTRASSFQAAPPPPPYDAGYAQVMAVTPRFYKKRCENF